MIRVYKRAILKFNNGNGALLCNQCRTIVAEGYEHTDVEHYCNDCRGRRAISAGELDDEEIKAMSESGIIRSEVRRLGTGRIRRIGFIRLERGATGFAMHHERAGGRTSHWFIGADGANLWHLVAEAALFAEREEARR